MIQESQHLQKVVWVIDDDETALMLAEEVLAGAGFKVRTFLDAATALAAAATDLPDLVVVDVIMPGINGFEFCSRLRLLPQGAMIPILVTTSLDDTASINKAYQAGATNFATKPINWAIEVQRLHYLLKSADLARELQRKELETRLAKEDWERTFNAINDPVTILDKDLKALRANKPPSICWDCPPNPFWAVRATNYFIAPASLVRNARQPLCNQPVAGQRGRQMRPRRDRV